MSQQGDSPISRCPARFQLMFVRACALTFVISLAFYAFTLTDMNAKTVRAVKSWNISTYIQDAVDGMQKVIKLSKLQRKRKLVLLWTDYFSSRNNWLPSTEELNCPVTDCDSTSNHSMLSQSSAVVLHWRDINRHKLPQCVPSENAQCPLWVLFNKEAPPHTPRDILAVVQERIHWTATYRKDSDIYAPYGKVVIKKKKKLATPEFDPNRSLLCWLVSNCDTPSKREVFVRELKNYIQVDVYGKCGYKKCPHKSSKDCYQWLSKKCKFYLSLENSNCKDYTTEKLYYALSSGMVPVVMGNSSKYDHLPPRSYINAADFSSPRELANYLVIAGNDRDLYLSYFWWTKTYEVIDYAYKWFCDLCEKLHEVNPESVKTHKNLVSWWFDQADCTSWVMN